MYLIGKYDFLNQLLLFHGYFGLYSTCKVNAYSEAVLRGSCLLSLFRHCCESKNSCKVTAASGSRLLASNLIDNISFLSVDVGPEYTK